MNFRDAIRANSRTVARLSDADLEALLPVLAEAREATAAGLLKWLKRVDGGDKYTAITHRQLISSLDESISQMKRELFPAIHRDLRVETSSGSLKALEAMKKAAIAGSKKFEDSAVPLRFDSAKVVLSTQKSLMSRHKASAARYAGRQGDMIRKQLAIGLVRGESIDATVSRLMGKPQLISNRMSDIKTADAIAENQFFRSRSDATRLVRTENIHAANVVQNDALIEDNENARDEGDGGDEDGGDTGGGGEGGWQKRWDATFDRNTCEDCADLDGEIVDAEDDFEEGVPHPPLHPNCRCTITPWREGWEL